MSRSSKKAIYIEINAAQAKKHNHEVCGDYYISFRDGRYTYVVLCDGIGSGTRAYISAVMCANRIIELMKSHMDLKILGHKIASFMKRARTEDNFPFAAFCVVAFSNDGRFRAISYENPEPLLAEYTTVSNLKHKYSTNSGEVIGICTGRLGAGDSLLIMSDGITQAGLGRLGGMGWTSQGFKSYANNVLQQNKTISYLLDDTLETVKELCGGRHKDDATIISLTAREANVLNILTGPPKEKKDDEKYVNDFLKLVGKKVICGSTTSEIFSRITKRDIAATPISSSFADPPKYLIDGIDLVTEGAATLNQAYNILDIDIEEYDELTAVTELCMLIKEADTINFMIGDAQNIGHKGLTFKQIGLLPRRTIVELIIKKLNEKGVQTEVYYY
jgi:hypothetical protein